MDGEKGAKQMTGSETVGGRGGTRPGLQSVRALACYICDRGWARGLPESAVEARLEAGRDRLAELLTEWRIDFLRQDEMMRACLGFSRRDLCMPPVQSPFFPEWPDRLRQVLAERPAVLFRVSKFHVVLGTADPLVAIWRDQIAMTLGTTVDLVYLTQEEVSRARRELLAGLGEKGLAHTVPPEFAERWLHGRDTPAAGLVEEMLRRAVESRATELQLRPGKDGGQVWFRLDGGLQHAMEYSTELHEGILAEMQELSGLSPEGPGPRPRTIDDVTYSVEPETWPGPEHEGLAVRLRYPLEPLPLPAELLERPWLAPLRSALESRLPGLWLLCSPALGGKSTSMQALLETLSDWRPQVCVIESRPGRTFGGTVQIAARGARGPAMETAVLTALRRGPELLAIDELDDPRVAALVLEAVAGGVCVLATLRAASPEGALARLAALGMADPGRPCILRGFSVQRLVRRVCPDCVKKTAVSEDLEKRLLAAGVPVPPIVGEGSGCRRCRRSGFSGLLAVGLHRALDGPPGFEGSSGSTLEADGLARVAAGETTFAELVRVMPELLSREVAPGKPYGPGTAGGSERGQGVSPATVSSASQEGPA